MSDLNQIIEKHPNWPLQYCILAQTFMQFGAKLEEIEAYEQEFLALMKNDRNNHS